MAACVGAAAAAALPGVAGAIDYRTLVLDDYGVLADKLAQGSPGCPCVTDVHALLSETAPEVVAPNPEALCPQGLSDGLRCLPDDYGRVRAALKANRRGAALNGVGLGPSTILVALLRLTVTVVARAPQPHRCST